MEDKNSRIYLFKYFYVIIMFLAILLLPFLLYNYENDYNEVLDEYNDVVQYAVSEGFSESSKNEILNLVEELKEANIIMHYKSFVSLMLIIIFLALFNFFVIKLGTKYLLLSNTPAMKLNKFILIVVTCVEMLYFVIVLVFGGPTYIGINFWTLFFINLIIVIFVIVLLLQIQFWFKPKKTTSS